VFLGWTVGSQGKHFYVRQLRDLKMSAVLEDWDFGLLRQYARMCAHALARAHARSGDAALIAGYAGSGAALDDAIAEFATAYSDQSRTDYRVFVKAIRQGRIEAHADL
jgi:predicted alpha/beta hydrolase